MKNILEKSEAMLKEIIELRKENKELQRKYKELNKEFDEILEIAKRIEKSYDCYC